MLKYICLSDQHAGAQMSLLTDLASDNFRQTSDVTQAFAAAFSAFLSQQSAKPQLIVLGDLLDLQFSSRAHATQSAYGYLEALRASGQLHDELIATAGNHDHALWSDARLSLETDTLIAGIDSDRSDTQDVRFRQTTKAFGKTKDAKSRLLTRLAKTAGFESVDLRYPNIGIGNRDRAILLHHGHFVEQPYRLMSRFQDFLLGQNRHFLTAEEIASENAGWIDFFWTALGETALKDPAYDIYQALLTVTGYRAKSAGWSAQIAERLSELLPLSGNMTIQALLHRMTQAGFDATLEAFADSERAAIVHTLTDDGWDGLTWYLDGVVRSQIDAELRKTSDKPDKPFRVNDLTFVFGHTHKPFADRVVSSASPNPVKVYNTGGWVLNGPRLDNAAGVSMVLIDDALNVVSVRLFDTPRNGIVHSARIELLSEDREDARTFAQSVQSWLDGSRPEWDHLRDTVKTAYELRQKILLDRTNPDHSISANAS